MRKILALQQQAVHRVNGSRRLIMWIPFGVILIIGMCLAWAIYLWTLEHVLYSLNLPGTYAVPVQMIYGLLLASFSTGYLLLVFLGLVYSDYIPVAQASASSPITNQEIEHPAAVHSPNTQPISLGIVGGPTIPNTQPEVLIRIDEETFDSSPRNAARNYYSALNYGVISGDFTAAYSLLSTSHQNRRAYHRLVSTYMGIQSIDLHHSELIFQNDRAARLFVLVKLQSERNGQVFQNEYPIVYDLVKENGKWKMDSYQVR